MRLTTGQRAELKAVAEFEPTGGHFWDRVNQQVTNEADLKAVARQAILDLLADLEEAEDRYECNTAIMHARTARMNELTEELATTRKQLAEAQARELNGREIRKRVKAVLALVINESEAYEFDDGLGVGIPQCVLDPVGDLHEELVVEQSWDRFQDALDGSNAHALQSAIAEAVEPYKRDAERLDYLQATQSTVSLHVSADDFDFVVGGLVVTKNACIRAAIDAALAAKEKSNG